MYFFLLRIRRPPRSTQSRSSAASDVYKRQVHGDVLKSAAKCNVSKLNKEASFEDLGFDSLDAVELVVAMEENLGVDLSNEEAEKITNVNDAITCLLYTSPSPRDRQKSRMPSSA
eukprot:TRINITY_DN4789_c0_g1_i16.p2 TRINITY_DN4789_c0_g1~~TRINITY_DN4789_c0_g1_i16.p2  ORF type:complete len:115 (+),score=73.47 TRINITY_DN4789_c0_g1_i16:1-345(+)